MRRNKVSLSGTTPGCGMLQSFQKIPESIIRARILLSQLIEYTQPGQAGTKNDKILKTNVKVRVGRYWILDAG